MRISIGQSNLVIRLLAEPVMLGREKELEALSRDLQTVIEGKGKTVFISAEAGIGKTRLVAEFLNSVKHENIIKLSGWCLFNAEIPYFPFVEAFSNYYSTFSEKHSEEELELNAWLKEPTKAELSGQLKYLNPQALKDQTFAAVAKAIRSLATKNPVILVLEDIHWADSASLALLHYIARALQNSERVLVLATFRSEELTNNSEGYPHQLVETLAMMRREDLFEQVVLSNLSLANVSKMAESMLGGVLRQDLAERLSVESEGNPLFVVEYLRMLNEQGNLVQKSDEWEWNLAVEKTEIPNKIRDIILRRLACLNNAQKRILDAAAVIGDEFEAGLLSAIVNEDSLDVLETLNIIAHTTALVCPDEDRFRFDHACSRETIYEAISKPLRLEYHKRIAEKLEGSKRASPLLSKLAYHYAQAGNKEKAESYALAAGQDELARWSNTEAIEHFLSLIHI